MRIACLARVASLALMPALAGMAFGAEAVSNNDGLTLPDGFSAVVVQEGQGTGRHLTVAANGDIYLAGWQRPLRAARHQRRRQGRRRHALW